MKKVAAIIAAILVALATVSATSARSNRGGWYITAYCLRGTTATGTRVHWGAIAVDPSVIPLGSRIWVEGYGYGRAEDTGGAVRGQHVDAWMPSCNAAFNFTHYGSVRWWRR